MSDTSVIERLATKLAAAGLTEDEVDLLRELIAGPQEVDGFGVAGNTVGAWMGILGGAKPLGGSDDGSFITSKPLTGNDNGSFVISKPLGGDDNGAFIKAT